MSPENYLGSHVFQRHARAERDASIAAAISSAYKVNSQFCLILAGAESNFEAKLF